MSQPPLAAPTPTMVNVGVARTNEPGSPTLVVLAVETCAGTGFYFIEPEHALEVARMLKSNARQAATGLIVPNGHVTLPEPPAQS